MSTDYQREWYQKNKDILSKKYLDNKDEILIKRKEYYNNNKDKIKDYNKKYREENLEEIKDYNKNYYEDNKDILLEKQKEYNELNKDKIREYQRVYKMIRINNDDLFRLSKNIRTLIKKSFNFKNSKKTVEIIGCTIEDFKVYIESKFEDWMSWENYGLYDGNLNYGWDIDHIIPLSSAKTEEDFYKLNCFTNLQPLCSKVNRYIKRDKMENTECLYCGQKLSYIKYCNDNCRKKYYRKRNEKE